MVTRSITYLLLAGSGAVGGIALFFAGEQEPASVNPAGDACPAVSASDEPRLNIAMEADQFGMVPPCRAEIVVYTPRHSQLAAVEGVITFTDDASGSQVRAAPIALALEPQSNGMRETTLSLPPIDELACRRATASLEIARCLSGDGQQLSCPDVRIARADPFGAFDVTGEQVSVCRAK